MQHPCASTPCAVHALSQLFLHVSMHMWGRSRKSLGTCRLTSAVHAPADAPMDAAESMSETVVEHRPAYAYAQLLL
jgi:hypothetical protein